ncbi:hypothetical protein LTR64_002068 [Lithohypha guttulata]|uniref:uncharacterized protein n=1 Tax=Lithohypha guttulata TaxID=1690604 RepID=UPI002DDEE268|nr:hypothetical protein LTR51_007926 [Lithohypha guttulata]
MPFTHINRRPTPHPHARIPTEPRAFHRSAQRATLLSRRQKKRLRDIAREGLAVLKAKARKAREEDLKVCWAFLKEVDKYVPRVGCGGYGGEAGERRKEEVKGYMSWEEFKEEEEKKNYEADCEDNGVRQSEKDEMEVSEGGGGGGGG